MRERLRRVPGAVNAAYSLYGPMSGDNWATMITVEGHAPGEELVASWNRVSPGYFDTVGTPLLRGRAIEDQDKPGSPLVTVVTQGFARKFFGDADPIGRRLGFTNSRGAGSAVIEIVGVVGDAKYQDGRAAPKPMFFLPFLQQTPRPGAAAPARLDRSHFPQALEVQTAGAVAGFEAEIRRALAEVDRRITIRNVQPLEDEVAGGFNLERLIARLTIVFGAVALLLACLGLYGVTAYSVTRRTREIGIRMAIGASRRDVLATILRGAILQLAIGVAIGLPAAFIAGRLLQAQLFATSGRDPIVLAVALAALALSTVAAALIPAGRAAAMNPVRALRIE
jgi:predicted permease